MPTKPKLLVFFVWFTVIIRTFERRLGRFKPCLRDIIAFVFEWVLVVFKSPDRLKKREESWSERMGFLERKKIRKTGTVTGDVFFW